VRFDEQSMTPPSSAQPGAGLPAPGACGCHVNDARPTDLASDDDRPTRDNHHTIKRLRRIEGQVRGLHRMIEENRYCADVLTQISSAHEALRAVARELMRSHLRHCAAAALESPGHEAEQLYDDLIEMMYKLGR
jgi:DNA-binding FrmR family transcriptional regulator